MASHSRWDHPGVRKLLEMMSANPSPPLWSVPLAEARTRTAKLGQMIGPGPDLPVARDLDIPGPAGPIPARLLSTADPDAVILFLHGGGWVMGSFRDLDASCRTLASTGNFAVLMPDYRLAPEDPYPAALLDSEASLRWLGDHINDLFGKMLPVILAGASAGGNLAAAAAQRKREPDSVAIAALFLIYPVLDADFETASYREEAENPFLDRPTMQWFWDQYVSDGDPRRDPAVSPLKQTDFVGHPATVIVTAERDPVRSEGEAYGRALWAAGIPVAMRTMAQMPHGFFTMVNQFDEAKEAIAFAVKHLRAFVTTASN